MEQKIPFVKAHYKLITISIDRTNGVLETRPWPKFFHFQAVFGKIISLCPLPGVRADLHQASASTLRQLSNDALEWVCNPFLRISIDFNENSIASIIAELSQH